MSDEEYYAALADELNDPSVHEPGPHHMSIEDFDADYVEGAKRYAEYHKLNWPPQVGDYDEYWLRNQFLNT